MSFVRRLCAATVVAAGFALSPASASAQDFTDIYITLTEPGWGVNAVQSDNFMFLTFFIYDENKNPTWYSGEASWDGTQFTGALYKTNGTFYGSAWNPADHPANTKVGNVSFKPNTTNSYQATIAYNVGTTNVTKAVERLALTTIALGGQYTGGQSGAYSSCTPASNNGSYTDFFDLTVTHLANGTVTFVFGYTGDLTCTNSGALEQHGGLYLIKNATYSCTLGGTNVLTTNAVLTDIKSTAQGIEGRLRAPSVAGCVESAAFSAVFN